MTSLFILQLICCVITAMLAIHLVMASFQVRWKVRRYEVSRWLLFVSMILFSIHYILQMIYGLRVQGADVGAVFNILFYTPVAFIVTLSIINIENQDGNILRYCFRSGMAYALILLAFTIGVFYCHSLHIGFMLYVMLGLFMVSMAYFIFVISHEIALRKKKLMADSGSDLIPYMRYSKTSIILLYLTATFLPIVILYNTLLYIMGPLMLLSIIFFIHIFISLGYYVTPKEEILEAQNKTLLMKKDSRENDVGG